jgi:hypothetical protein
MSCDAIPFCLALRAAVHLFKSIDAYTTIDDYSIVGIAAKFNKDLNFPDTRWFWNADSMQAMWRSCAKLFSHAQVVC